MIDLKYQKKLEKRLVGSVVLVTVLAWVAIVCMFISMSALNKKLDAVYQKLDTICQETSLLNDKLDEVIIGSGDLLRLQEEAQGLEDHVQKQKIEMYDNDMLRDTIKRLSFNPGISRAGEGLHEDLSSDEIEFVEHLGKMRLSFYTPCTEECGSNSGITSSGQPVVGGYTVAADTSFWPYGTKFYIEGFGVVEVMDTGGAIKGSHRLDICLVTDRSKAMNMGIQYRDVWLIN